ncbi:MAG: trigger factor [Ignavibacteria bacterium]|nr:trigger factor [Ignavibacteria bacterium]
MDIKLNDLNEVSKSKKVLEAELSYEELTPHFDKAIAEYRKKATIPGFRKGKAPLNMIKKLYGEGLEYNALEDIANDIFHKYIVDNKVDILGKGAITDLDYKPKEKLNFKIEFEVMPEIKIDKYKGLELKKTKYKIDDLLVDDEIQYHKFRNATNEIDGIASDDDYIITVDLQNMDEAGNILIGQSQKDLRIYLGNPQIYPEFKEGFKGIKEGETRIINSKNAEGGPKKVEAKCTKVEKIVYPEMNEEFFKKITGKDTLKTFDEFKSEIKGELEKIYNGIADRKLRADVISELIKSNEVEAPEVYIDFILKSMIDEYKHQSPKHELPKDFNAEEFKKERRVDAILQAKWYLIREKMIEMEKVIIEDEDYKKIAEENAGRYNIPADKLIDAYKENEDVKMKILNDKVLDIVLAKAKIEEIEELKTKDNIGETED